MLYGEIKTPANTVEVFFCLRILQWIMFTQDVLVEKNLGITLLRAVNAAMVARDTKQLKNLEKKPLTNPKKPAITIREYYRNIPFPQSWERYI